MGKLSEKPPIVEYIFYKLWDESSQTLRRTVVTMADVQEGIRWSNANRGTKLKDTNPANFLKDVIRGRRASRIWPEALQGLRFTAKQVTGDGRVLEFVPYAPGQQEAFPDRFALRPDTPRHDLQSLSIPLASKELGRNDETYLIQVAVKLAVIETHFALHSPLPILELNHLQIGIKLRLCEVDSLFAATCRLGSENLERILITCEAKKKGQRILEDQVVQQMRAAFRTVESINIVVPLAMAAVKGGIHVVEFKAVRRAELDSFKLLELQSEAVYYLKPPVKGI